jgi:hypothetical protein
MISRCDEYELLVSVVTGGVLTRFDMLAVRVLKKCRIQGQTNVEWTLNVNCSVDSQNAIDSPSGFRI